MSPAEWIALMTAVAALVAAVLAWRQLREAKTLREEQAKPYVVATMDSNPNSYQHVELTVKNYGRTAATDVQISATPRLRMTDGSGGIQDVWLPEQIPVLAPGQVWRTLLDVATTRKGTPELRDEERYEVLVEFKGLKGNPDESRSVIDWGAYRGQQVLSEWTVHDLAKSVDKLREAAQELVGHATSSGAGLNVWVRDGAEEDERRAADCAAAKARRDALVSEVQRAQQRRSSE